MKRIIFILLLLIVIATCCAASCSGGEYCDDGKHYEWRDIGTTAVPVCVE